MIAKQKKVRLLVPWNRSQKGAELVLSEPVADTLIRSKIAKAVAGQKLSKGGTKSISRTKVSAKG
jgi:hypothetical protein